MGYRYFPFDVSWGEGREVYGGGSNLVEPNVPTLSAVGCAFAAQNHREYVSRERCF